MLSLLARCDGRRRDRPLFRPIGHAGRVEVAHGRIGRRTSTRQATYKAALLMHAGLVVRDVQTADQRLACGYDFGLDNAMSFLATDFSDLEADGVPPGADAAKYLADCSAG